MIYHYQRRYCGPLQLVIFDWAGTTIDHGSRAPVAAFAEGFRRKGIDVTLAQARGPMGMGKRDHIRVMTEMPPIAAQWQEVHGRPVNEADIDEMYDEFVPVLMDVLPDYSTLIAGVVETVAALRDMGCKIGSTTGYFTEAMDLCAVAAARQGYVPDSTIAATQVSAGRPAPWLIFATMERLGIYPPEAVVNVGDTVPDIESGLNAGTWTVGMAEVGNGVGFSAAELAALPPAERNVAIAHARQILYQTGAHYVINRPDELLAVVQEINTRLARGERP